MKKFDMFLMDWQNVLAFGFWMNDQQTEDEIEKGATIEKNNRGWNKPDGYRYTLWLESLRRMHDISMEEVQEAVDELRSSLERYFRQWQEFYGDPYWTRNLPEWTKELPAKRQKERRIVVMRNLDDDRYVKAIYGANVELTSNRKEAMYLREDQASKIVEGSDRIWLQFTSGADQRADRKRAQEERRKIRQEYEHQTRVQKQHIEKKKICDGPLCLVVDAKGKYLSGLKGSDPLWSKARSEAVVWPETKAMEWVEENRAWRGLSMSDKKIIRIR